MMLRLTADHKRAYLVWPAAPGHSILKATAVQSKSTWLAWAPYGLRQGSHRILHFFPGAMRVSKGLAQRFVILALYCCPLLRAGDHIESKACCGDLDQVSCARRL